MNRPLANIALLVCLMAAMAAKLPAFACIAMPPSTTPEPSTILLVAGAAGALLVIRHLRRKK